MPCSRLLIGFDLWADDDLEGYDKIVTGRRKSGRVRNILCTKSKLKSICLHLFLLCLLYSINNLNKRF